MYVGRVGDHLKRSWMDNAYTCAQVREPTLDHATAIRRKIGDLKRLKRVIEEMAAKCGGEGAPECAVIDALLGRFARDATSSRLRRDSLFDKNARADTFAQ